MKIFPVYTISARYTTKPRSRKDLRKQKEREERGCVAALAMMRMSLAACRRRRQSSLLPAAAFSESRYSFHHCRSLATSSNISTTIDDNDATATATTAASFDPVKRVLVVGGGVAGRQAWVWCMWKQGVGEKARHNCVVLDQFGRLRTANHGQSRQ